MHLKYGILTLAVSMAVAACNTADNTTWRDTRGDAGTPGTGRNIQTTDYNNDVNRGTRTNAMVNGANGDISSMHQPLADNPQAPGNDKNRMVALSDADRQFINSAMAGGQYEVNAGDKAATHSNNQQIKTLAQYIIDDHSKANNQLKDLASRKGINTPFGITTDQTDKLAQLDKLNGADFDAEFLRQQKAAHEDAVNLFQNESSNGTDKDLRDWASATLPTLRNHLDMVNALSGNNLGMAR